MPDRASAIRRWALRRVPPEPRSIIELIRDGTLDPELAAQLWLLVGGRVPVVVAAESQGAGKTTLLRALLDFVPPDVRIVELAGEAETFEWLPQASELGWPGTAHPVAGYAPVRPETAILLASELSDHLPTYTWGAAARVFVRAASIGYGLAATIHADSLDGVLTTMRAAPVRLGDDELSHLGIVLVLRPLGDGRRRVVAAHYLRPVARDLHGHIQRLGPAVLATWDAGEDAFEHFGWGVTPELARRIGLRAGDFEVEADRRRTYIEGLLEGGPVETDGVRAAIAASRPAVSFDAPGGDA